MGANNRQAPVRCIIRLFDATPLGTPEPPQPVEATTKPMVDSIAMGKSMNYISYHGLSSLGVFSHQVAYKNKTARLNQQFEIFANRQTILQINLKNGVGPPSTQDQRSHRQPKQSHKNQAAHIPGDFDLARFLNPQPSLENPTSWRSSLAYAALCHQGPPNPSPPQRDNR